MAWRRVGGHQIEPVGAVLSAHVSFLASAEGAPQEAPAATPFGLEQTPR